MPRTGRRGQLDEGMTRIGFQFAAGDIEAEDPDLVGAEIGNVGKLVGGIEIDASFGRSESETNPA